MSNWHIDEMLAMLTKWQAEKIASWQNVKLTKCQVDKMAGCKIAIWHNGKLTKWQIKNGKLTKSQVDKMEN